MAMGTVKIDGDEILEALTFMNRSYTRELTGEGEALADLIAERVIAEILKRLGTKPAEE
jgi:hypothetical protein